MTFTMRPNENLPLPKGQKVNLYLNQEVSTWDTEANHMYDNFEAHYCGTIALKGLDKAGEQIWEEDKNAPDPGDFYKTELDGERTYQSPSS